MEVLALRELRERNLVGVLLLLLCVFGGPASAAEIYFREGVDAYRAGKYADAAQSFRHSLDERPATGTLVNLGMAEWRRGRLGDAVVAWEQAVWLNPLDSEAQNNLKFARDAAQLDTPELTWCERASTWLPANVWTLAASGGLALALAAMVLPGFFRVRKAGWHQAVAAAGWCVVLLSIAPCVGIVTRANIGIVLDRNTPLLLTPTKEGEAVSSLPMGEPVRKLRERGDFVLVRTQNGLGWIHRARLGFICPSK